MHILHSQKTMMMLRKKINNLQQRNELLEQSVQGSEVFVVKQQQHHPKMMNPILSQFHNKVDFTQKL